MDKSVVNRIGLYISNIVAREVIAVSCWAIYHNSINICNGVCRYKDPILDDVVSRRSETAIGILRLADEQNSCGCCVVRRTE